MQFCIAPLNTFFLTRITSQLISVRRLTALQGFIFVTIHIRNLLGRHAYLKFLLCITEVHLCGSNLEQRTYYPHYTFVIFLSASKRMLTYYFKWATAASSLQYIFTLSFNAICEHYLLLPSMPRLHDTSHFKLSTFYFQLPTIQSSASQFHTRYNFHISSWKALYYY
jgi:hypothetical protein